MNIYSDRVCVSDSFFHKLFQLHLKQDSQNELVIIVVDNVVENDDNVIAHISQPKQSAQKSNEKRNLTKMIDCNRY